MCYTIDIQGFRIDKNIKKFFCEFKNQMLET